MQVELNEKTAQIVNEYFLMIGVSTPNPAQIDSLIYESVKRVLTEQDILSRDEES